MKKTPKKKVTATLQMSRNHDISETEKDGSRGTGHSSQREYNIEVPGTPKYFKVRLSNVRVFLEAESATRDPPSQTTVLGNWEHSQSSL